MCGRCGRCAEVSSCWRRAIKSCGGNGWSSIRGCDTWDPPPPASPKPNPHPHPLLPTRIGTWAHFFVELPGNEMSVLRLTWCRRVYTTYALPIFVIRTMAVAAIICRWVKGARSMQYPMRSHTRGRTLLSRCHVLQGWCRGVFHRQSDEESGTDGRQGLRRATMAGRIRDVDLAAQRALLESKVPPPPQPQPPPPDMHTACWFLLPSCFYVAVPPLNPHQPPLTVWPRSWWWCAATCR